MIDISKFLSVADQEGIELPNGYRTVIELNLVNLKPWQFLAEVDSPLGNSSINRRYPKRLVLPFARRIDSDDVACFVMRDPEQEAGQVIVIHDFASSGYEVVARMQWGLV
jgi:hypothetical protein